MIEVRTEIAWNMARTIDLNIEIGADTVDYECVPLCSTPFAHPVHLKNLASWKVAFARHISAGFKLQDSIWITRRAYRDAECICDLSNGSVNKGTRGNIEQVHVDFYARTRGYRCGKEASVHWVPILYPRSSCSPQLSIHYGALSSRLNWSLN